MLFGIGKVIALKKTESKVLESTRSIVHEYNFK
jgi:hypothetical protein